MRRTYIAPGRSQNERAIATVRHRVACVILFEMGTAGAGTDLDGDEATVVERSGCEARASGVAALAQGDLLGRYVIIDRLGEGAMGVVFRAYDPKLRREVALKLLRDASAGKSVRARLLREAQALATLSHPNVVALYDAELTEHGVCLAMEYVQGSTLRAWLRARPRRWEEVSNVVLAAARGLAAAHARGLVHRDVKPDNVLVGSDGRVRITDFGLVRALDETRQDAESSDPIADDTATAYGVVLGSPAYMAPEQHAGKQVDARADQYALCVTLWEALHGSRSFAGKDLEALARAKQGGPPAPPSRRVPRWLHALMAKGLAVVPEQRWTSVDALVDALAHGRARARRRRVGVTLGLVGSTLVGAASWQQIDRSRRVVACERAGAEIDEVWNARVATQVHDALLDTGLAYADATYEKLVPWVDRWTRAWSEVRTQVCSDASVEHTLSSDLHASAVDCLDERREALVGLLDALARPDAAAVQRAVPAAAGLAAPDRCVIPGQARAAGEAGLPR